MKSSIRSIVLLVAIVTGCAEQPEEVDSRESPFGFAGMTIVNGPATNVAMALTWWPVYWQSAPAPTVYWVRPNCNNGRDVMYGGQCLSGVYFPQANYIFLAMRGLTVSLTSVPFAHELCHAAMYAQSGDPDANHVNGCYYTGGQAEAANAVLTANGL